MKPDWYSNVQPRRVIKPKPRPWFCECEDYYLGCPDQRQNPGYLVACPDCDTRRPGA